MITPQDMVAVAGVTTQPKRHLGRITNGALCALRYWESVAAKTGQREVAALLSHAQRDLRFKFEELLRGGA